jgi:hypothetical protein
MVASNKNIGTILQQFQKELIKELQETNKSLSRISSSLELLSVALPDKRAETAKRDGE